MTRYPKNIRDLIATGYGVDAYLKNCKWFAKRGILIGYSQRRREWFFQLLHGSDESTATITLWCGVGAFVDRLNSRSSTVRDIRKMADLANRAAEDDRP